MTSNVCHDEANRVHHRHASASSGRLSQFVVENMTLLFL